MTKIAFMASLALLSLCSFAQEEAKKTYNTSWREGEILIDGKMDDTAWENVEWGGDFVGHEPEYNVKPSQETQFKILYDAKYLYVGIRAYDSDPEKIVKRMSRRDGFDGDWVEINIDSYYDQRSAFSFTASVSGVKGDEYISNNGDNWDATWDPIWYMKTSVDDLGWIAEFKIPLSQLRFANKENHVWGIQFTRRLFRKEERSTWQPVNPTAPGWVHLFGELHGISGIKPQKQLEVQPYVVGAVQSYQKEPENPFRDSGRELEANIGVDAKIGITSDITLDLTVNPDFGQVEADPSRVNLSAFRLFFREQRPFFLEGNNILTFPTSGGQNNLYYSRRIGGRPNGYPEGDDVEYVDMPKQTRILGAAKITGKNSKGFSWGVMESFTNREIAGVVDTLGVRREEKVEPYTNYIVARAQQDIQSGKTVVGAFYSNVSRVGNAGNDLSLLHDQAHSTGFDLDHNFKDRKYGFILRGMFSHVEGSPPSIHNTQTAPERFFQRPNNRHRELDSTRTQLQGTAGTFAFGKRSGNWQWVVGTNYRSPGLSLNDVGFLVQTDNINNWGYTQYRVIKPTKYFRSQKYSFHFEQNLDFGGVETRSGGEVNFGWQFHNFWYFGTGTWVDFKQISNADLRGGPAIQYPGGVNYYYELQTNQRKKLSVGFENWYYWGDYDFTQSRGGSLSLYYRPLDAMSVSLSPNISFDKNTLQYVDHQDLNGKMEYLLAQVKQETYSMSLRVNYNITPNLTLEFWGQPFLAKGEYDAFKFVKDPKSGQYKERFAFIDQSRISFDSEESEYAIDEEFVFDDPDFNVVEFRSNFVMRWEYIPGSTLFLVWSNNGTNSNQSENNQFGDLSSNLVRLNGTNTFLVKYTYRFIR
ncbi:MAG: DUF5916 domain-containing protein [Cyclobacteriaceae bacterium]